VSIKATRANHVKLYLSRNPIGHVVALISGFRAGFALVARSFL
jgi:hypothetical protein